MSASAQLILVAGGMGTRLGSELPKALVPLQGIPLFVRSLRAFDSAGLCDNAIVVYPVGHESAFRAALDEFCPMSSATLVAGGEKRYHSVCNGLRALSESTEIVAVHDAARPFAGNAVIRDALDAAEQCGAATVARPCTDTILQSNAEQCLESTPDRSVLWACQTPQVFRRSVIEHAYRGAIPSSLTDDATLVRGTGQRVQIVEGPDTNIKITTQHDMEYAAHLLEKGLV